MMHRQQRLRVDNKRMSLSASPSPHSQLHFFRGVDVALLMFDVNQPATPHILTR
ncbi:hypothetical protein BGW80DRAFT_1392456 [Lactifluus volemus]|nr:hypothetical protein BGW80DRAFT_1392456 [Lactifluus volemus]